MSDNDNFGFGKLVPGFDFLQNIAKGASQMPNLSNWVAPTLNPEELEKRIGELKAVHFWLDQNSKALGATIQALEVQKMTLATLKGMNFNMGDVANAFKLKTPDSVAASAPKVSEKAAPTANANSGAAGHEQGRRQEGREGRWTARGWHRRSAAVVGRAHPAIPADRSRRLERRGSANGRGHGQEHGSRHGQGSIQDGRRRGRQGCDRNDDAQRAKDGRQARYDQEVSRPPQGRCRP